MELSLSLTHTHITRIIHLTDERYLALFLSTNGFVLCLIIQPVGLGRMVVQPVFILLGSV